MLFGKKRTRTKAAIDKLPDLTTRYDTKKKADINRIIAQENAQKIINKIGQYELMFIEMGFAEINHNNIRVIWKYPDWDGDEVDISWSLGTRMILEQRGRYFIMHAHEEDECQYSDTTALVAFLWDVSSRLVYPY